MTLSKGNTGVVYKITSVETQQDELSEFLFSLGCYPDEKITIISKLASNLVINVKDARYSIDDELAKAISIEELCTSKPELIEFPA